MDFNLEIGMKGSIEQVVAEKDTAVSFGSGGVEVFATPMMVGIMEGAALKAVDPLLPEGFATVGTHLEIDHIAATPMGMSVRAEAKLIEINGKKLKFSVMAYDEKELIGKGFHSRYIINLEKFIGSVKEKKK